LWLQHSQNLFKSQKNKSFYYYIDIHIFSVHTRKAHLTFANAIFVLIEQYNERINKHLRREYFLMNICDLQLMVANENTGRWGELEEDTRTIAEMHRSIVSRCRWNAV